MRTYAPRDQPYTRVSLADLTAVFSYDRIAAMTGAETASQSFTASQVKRIASGRAYVDTESGLTADLMLDYYEYPPGTGACACLDCWPAVYTLALLRLSLQVSSITYTERS